MKHIIYYRIFESIDFTTVRDILLDLTDEGYKFNIHSHPNPTAREYKHVRNLDTIVTISKSSRFTLSDIRDCISRLSGYMETEGYNLNTTTDENRQPIVLSEKINKAYFTYRFSPLALMRAKSKYKI